MEIGPATRAVVTGASRGIGRAVAGALAARGATVGLAARSSERAGGDRRAAARSHHTLTCDVTLRGSVASAIDRFVMATGGIDLLVVNAGVAHYEPVASQSLEHIEQMTQVNWLGTVYTVKAALPQLVHQGRGHVVVMSSASGLRSVPGAAAYGAMTAAQRMFADALRHELAGSGVSLTTVVPGEIRTSLHDHEASRIPGWYRGGPLAATPEALAERVLRAVERDRRHLHFRPAVRGMGMIHGLSPRAADAVLRRLRGATAAPRRG